MIHRKKDFNGIRSQQEAWSHFRLKYWIKPREIFNTGWVITFQHFTNYQQVKMTFIEALNGGGGCGVLDTIVTLAVFGYTML
jgi:hypothetical protein